MGRHRDAVRVTGRRPGARRARRGRGRAAGRRDPAGRRRAHRLPAVRPGHGGRQRRRVGQRRPGGRRGRRAADPSLDRLRVRRREGRRVPRGRRAGAGDAVRRVEAGGRAGGRGGAPGRPARAHVAALRRPAARAARAAGRRRDRRHRRRRLLHGRAAVPDRGRRSRRRAARAAGRRPARAAARRRGGDASAGTGSPSWWPAPPGSTASGCGPLSAPTCPCGGRATARSTARGRRRVLATRLRGPSEVLGAADRPIYTRSQWRRP